MEEKTTPPLVVVSNRGPMSFRFEGDRLVAAGTAGGLAGSLRDLLVGTDATWVACAMSAADRAAAEQGLMRDVGLTVRTVAPDPQLYSLAYDVVANATLWFVHHHLFDLPRRPRFDRRWYEAWDAYRQFNALMAATTVEHAPEGAVVLVQDYHLGLIPAMVRRQRPDLAVVHFSHTPFADPGVLRVLPGAARRELLQGMAAATGCGFHTERWAQAFTAGCLDNGVEPPAVFVAPLVPDANRLAERLAGPGCQTAAERLAGSTSGRKLVVRVDRVEPSKNLARSFWAVDELLQAHPEHRGTMVLLSLAYASRQGLPDYLAYRAEVEQTAAAVNERWQRDGWRPIELDIADDPDRSLAALSLADVILVNPVRDGLNLVAEEGPLVNRRDAALVLSVEAGAHAEIGDLAISVNPFDITETADALHRALTLTSAERAGRAAALRERILARPPRAWLEDQLAASTGA
jgi:trehalose 6-phosphate synthase